MLARTTLASLVLMTGAGLAFAQEDTAANATPSPDAASAPFLRLEFDRLIEREALTEELAADPHFIARSEDRVAVTLGPRVVEIAVGGSRRLLDYAAGREYVIDDEAGTYTAGPLVRMVGALHMEMANRLQMRRALEIADVTDPSLELPELTILFGHRIQGDLSKTSTQTDETGRTTTRLDDLEIASWTASEHALTDAERDAFDRFLQVSSHLHPDVRTALTAADRVPATLHYRWRNVAELDTATWTLISAARSDTAPRGVAGRKRSFAGSELTELAEAILAADPDDVPGPPDRDAFATSAAEASAAGKHDDAMLLLLESSLSNGDTMQAEIEATISAPGAQDIVRSLMRTIALANSQPTAALAQIEKLDRSRFSRPHVLDVFRANALTAANREGEAKDLLLATLSSVPYLVAGYKDLGDLYYGEFQTWDAWLAWEIGRAISRDHGCWAQIDAHEERLRATYPERL